MMNDEEGWAPPAGWKPGQNGGEGVSSSAPGGFDLHEDDGAASPARSWDDD